MTHKSSERRARGFTMVETLMVVAITVILMGVAFVGVINYRRSALKLELDATAKEIYIAAQNHLLTASDEGLINGSSLALGTQTGTYYYFRGGEGASTAPNSVLDVMLPFGSIDESIRKGGSYIVWYQPESGLIKRVCYTKPDGIGGLFGSFGAKQLADNDGATLLSMSIEDFDYNVGVYEGTDLDIGSIKRPKLQVTNGDKLIATITNPNSGDTGYKLVLLIESGNAHEFYTLVDGAKPVRDSSGFNCENVNVSVNQDRSEFSVILDDVTQDGNHFYDLFTFGRTDPSMLFVPGDDITLSVFAARTDRKLANVAWSARITTNSLFESVDENTNIAKISSFRHIENLDSDVSGIGETVNTVQGIALKGAKQLTDLDWNAFISDNASVSNSLNIYTKRLSSSKSENNTIFPISNLPEEFEYDGSRHRVLNVEATNTNSDAVDVGLFGTVSHVVVKNLDLVNFDVQTTNGTAGALAGSMENCSVEGVLAYNDMNLMAWDVNTEEDHRNDARLAVKGSGEAGGLVGIATNCTFTNCGAAVYVASNTGCAGGLIGKVAGNTSNDSALNLCYSGGHTSAGKYLTAIDAGDSEPGRFNVQASNSSAGGLIGEITGQVSVNNSYSTCSVLGKTVAGGLIGSMGSNSVSNSYATGIVSGSEKETKAGAFIGLLTGVSVGTGNEYLSIANGEMPAVGDQPEFTGIEDGSENLQKYQAFAPYSSDARPYDDTLGQKYLYKVLVPDSVGDNRLKVHHGDWQDYATLVVNTPTGGTTE